MAAIAYLIHDLNDAAVARRVSMFQAGGATVRLGGFHRRAVPGGVCGSPAADFGATQDARLLARLGAVSRHLVLPGPARSVVEGADVIVARNLEMLAIAARVAQPGQRLVYESLDIHRLLLSPSRAGQVIQAVERRLLDRVDLVLTSAPAFRDSYFRGRQNFRGAIRVEENRLLSLGGSAVEAIPATDQRAGPPWRIGWFGMLRCRRTLAILQALVRDHSNLVEVTIAGVPSEAEFQSFEADVAIPGMRYLGRYAADDLPQMYGAVDFAWAIDYFEEGGNSDWLLPNRLYESLALGAVPIALASVETGRWLAQHGVGLTVDDPSTDLAPLLAALTQDALAARRRAVAALPRDLLVAGEEECEALTMAVVRG